MDEFTSGMVIKQPKQQMQYVLLWNQEKCDFKNPDSTK
jgi:hypothetical protein